MITSEIRTPTATIRIHDEYFDPAPETCISRLSRIVSESYKRRQLQNIIADASAPFPADREA